MHAFQHHKRAASFSSSVASASFQCCQASYFYSLFLLFFYSSWKTYICTVLISTNYASTVKAMSRSKSMGLPRTGWVGNIGGMDGVCWYGVVIMVWQGLLVSVGGWDCGRFRRMNGGAEICVRDHDPEMERDCCEECEWEEVDRYPW